MRRIGLIGLVTSIAGFLPLTAFAAKIDIPTVYVGNAGNAPDSTGYGAVAYDYRIGITEVTNAQYVAFLNAKAASDPVRLYSALMPVDGGITRSGADGNYTYATIEGRENMPAVDVDWFDMVRFANWLHNGQGNGDTETGAYTLGRLRPDGLPLDLASVTRNPGALWYLPNEDEWYKAAYHKNDGATGNYFDFPTSSDSAPVHEPPPGGANSANYNLTVGAFVTEVGAYGTSKSPYGTLDQGGNAFEYTETLVDVVFRVARGGSWNNDSVWLRSTGRTGADPTYYGGTIGFRVATIPEPGSVILAGIGLITLLVVVDRRRRNKSSHSGTID